MLALLFAPLRLKVVQLLTITVVFVAVLASVSWFIADSWTDDRNGATVAFLLVFTASITSTVVLWRAAAHGRSRRERTLDSLLMLSPSDFEFAVARLMRRDGYRDVSVVGGSGDLAADIVARTRHKKIVVVQCKRKAPGQRVGSAEMQKFIGMVSVHHEADLGVFVTTSEYTQPALELAHQHGILLIDGVALADIVNGRRTFDASTLVAA